MSNNYKMRGHTINNSVYSCLLLLKVHIHRKIQDICGILDQRTLP